MNKDPIFQAIFYWNINEGFINSYYKELVEAFYNHIWLRMSVTIIFQYWYCLHLVNKSANSCEDVFYIHFYEIK